MSTPATSAATRPQPAIAEIDRFRGRLIGAGDVDYDDARAIRDGGGNGSIIGRNSFQRPRDEALELLGKLVEIYKGRG